MTVENSKSVQGVSLCFDEVFKTKAPARYVIATQEEYEQLTAGATRTGINIWNGLTVNVHVFASLMLRSELAPPAGFGEPYYFEFTNSPKLHPV